jgi:hypothetical protein
MQAPTTVQSSKGHKGILFWISCAYGVSVFAFLVIGLFLYWFYIGLASVPPNTGIRPMALAALLCLISLGSIFISGVCAVVGVVLCLKRGRWLLAFVAVLAFALSWPTFFIIGWGLDHVAALRQVYLEP